MSLVLAKDDYSDFFSYTFTILSHTVTLSFGLFYALGNIFVDRTLQVVLYGVGCGMSGSWWRNQHNKHHAMPQKIGHDVDLNTLPLVAFTEKVRNSDNPDPAKAYLLLEVIIEGESVAL